MTIQAGYTAEADDITTLAGIFFKNHANVAWNAADVGFDAKLNGTGVPSWYNYYQDIYTADNSYAFNDMTWDNVNEYWRTVDHSPWADYYVDIYASGITSGDFTINNCTTKQIQKNADGTGIWRVYCTAGTAAVRRASVLATLFWGTASTSTPDPRVTKAGSITTLTKLETSAAGDVGLHFYNLIWDVLCGAGDVVQQVASRTGTFSITSGNTVPSWSWVAGGGGTSTANWQIPVGSIRNSSNASSNEIATDTTGDTQTNPSNCMIQVLRSNAGSATQSVRLLIATLVGTLSFGAFTTNGPTETTYTLTDFSASKYILATSTFSRNPAYVILNNTTSGTITNAYGTWGAGIDAGNSLAVSLAADATNYQTITDAVITRFSVTGTTLKIKFNITRNSTAVVDYIYNHAVLYNLYT